MKTLGIIGGIGPESTIDYYRLIIASYRQQKGDGSYPAIIINSVDLNKLVDLITANELDAITEYLVGEIDKLAKAGADFAVLASNTPHIVFDEIERRSTIPLISIVEAACQRVQALGMKRVGLFGTRFTMQGSFYPQVFSRSRVELFVPDEIDQTYIHEKYMGELLKDVFLPETRQRLLAIADELKAYHAIEGLILGGTELPLLLRDEEHNGVRLLNTTQIHVERIVKALLV
ncbi:MAG TPA: amino acid racemase [Pyrinomonadaceae bacterium]|nr:amino acid racemase [Pyrinomonadaceae bacterium]